MTAKGKCPFGSRRQLGTDITETEQQALYRAEKLMAKKIAALKARIKKLEEMEFTIGEEQEYLYVD